MNEKEKRINKIQEFLQIHKIDEVEAIDKLLDYFMISCAYIQFIDKSTEFYKFYENTNQINILSFPSHFIRYLEDI